jgi:hypothetical protein
LKKLLLPLLILIAVAIIGSNNIDSDYQKYTGKYKCASMEIELTENSFKFSDNGPYGDAIFEAKGEQTFIKLEVCGESTPGNNELHITRGVTFHGEFIENFLIITDSASRSWKFTKSN